MHGLKVEFPNSGEPEIPLTAEQERAMDQALKDAQARVKERARKHG